jgi:hypothetical protein
MAKMDRLKESLFALVKAALPRIDYYPLYFGRVVSWHDEVTSDGAHVQTVDVQPNDPKLPTMAHVPFRHGLPGVVLKVVPGTSVLVGWENGDPSLNFACLWQGGEHVQKLILNADQIVLGGEDGAQPAVLGDVLREILATIATHTHPPIPPGGGPVVVSAELADLPDPRAQNVRVK